jgi:uncharacterized membrane protein YGL010W
MLKQGAFAHSIAATTGVVYIIFYVLALVVPGFFEFLFNAQFLGADVASLIRDLSVGNFVATLLGVVVVTWLIGYVWAGLYNRFSK